MKITDIDPNFRLNRKVPEDTVFFSPLEPPFSLHGVFYEDGRYRRMPEAVAASVSEGVLALHANTAGGRLRFRTDSPRISLCARLDRIGKMSHFALTGSAGFDLYRREPEGESFTGTFIPEWDVGSEFQSTVNLPGSGLREYTLHFPLYSDVTELAIGLAPGAALEAPEPYLPVPPMVFYGSSITQGGCASRPGNCCQNILSRQFRVDHVNLGFSGNALGEEAMLRYAAGLPMSLFVLDYDFNAPDPAHLQATHRRAYEIIRAAHPDIPIVMLSRPRFRLNREDTQRMEIVKATCTQALQGGDRNVYFIPGPRLMQYCGTDGTVDGTHPTDLGFASMSRTIGDFLQELGLYAQPSI